MSFLVHDPSFHQSTSASSLRLDPFSRKLGGDLGPSLDKLAEADHVLNEPIPGTAKSVLVKEREFRVHLCEHENGDENLDHTEQPRKQVCSEWSVWKELSLLSHPTQRGLLLPLRNLIIASRTSVSTDHGMASRPCNPHLL